MRADLFGLAVTLLSRLLGPPGRGPPLPEAFRGRLEDRLDEPELWAPIDDVPGAADVLRRCLRRDRERRYPDARLWAPSRLRPRAPAGPPSRLVQKASAAPPPKAQQPLASPSRSHHVLTRLRNRTANRSVTWAAGETDGEDGLARPPAATWVTAEGVWGAAETSAACWWPGLAADADIHVVRR